MTAFEGELAGQELGDVGNHLAPGLDDRDVRADEAGQVAHVRRCGDDQRLVELLDQFFGAGVHLPSARYSSASRYPSGPLPITRFFARSEMREFRRHSSRASMFDRWTS